MNLPISSEAIISILTLVIGGILTYSRFLARLAEGENRFKRIEEDMKAIRQSLEQRVTALETSEKTMSLALGEFKVKIDGIEKSIERVEVTLKESFAMIMLELKSKVDVQMCESMHRKLPDGK